MNDYRVFIWDFDGTLYDTYGRITRAALKAMEDLGLPLVDVDVQQLSKVTLREACTILAGEERAEELHARFWVHAESEGPESMQPFQGAREALQGVIARGGVNFLYTHRDHTALDALKRDGLEDLFRDFITREAGFAFKPSPEALNWLIDQHRLEREECLMIGDRSIDALAGNNAGIKSVLYDPDHYFAADAADFIFQSLEDIPCRLMPPLEEGWQAEAGQDSDGE